MEKESNIWLGETIILLALFVQNLIFGQRYILSRSSDKKDKRAEHHFVNFVWETKEQSLSA